MNKHTPAPWEYVPSTEHHGPYVTSEFGSTICDCYTMSQPGLWSTANGGPSKPVLFLAEMADPNARLIAAAPELFAFANHPVMEWLLVYALTSVPEPQRTSVELFLVPMRNAAIAKAEGTE